LLILKSCIDLQKFDVQGVKTLKRRYLDQIDKRTQLPKELELLLELCLQIFNYALHMKRPEKDSDKKKDQLEVVKEENEESDFSYKNESK
jgi:hypothetical protein